MKLRPTYLIPICCFSACGSPSAPEATPAAQVTVIFRDCPVQTSTDRFEGLLTTLPETVVNYVDSACVMRSYIPPQTGTDTLVVPTWGGYAEIMHRNQAIEDNYYLLEAGDTVLFTYGDNRRPHIRSLRSERLTRRYNLPEEDPRAVQPATGYTTRTTCRHDMYRMMWRGLHNPKYRKNPQYREMLEKFRRQCPDLDSLQEVLAACEADYAARLDSLERCGDIPARYAAYLKGRHLPRDTHERDSCVLASDSLMHYPFAHRLTYALPPSKFTAEDCARIAADTALSRYARAAALRYLMQRMATNDGGWTQFPTDLVRACNEVYVRLTGDTTYTPEVIVGRTCIEGGYSNDLVLEDTGGRRYDYADILHRHRGKVIYIDLWASWCGPCCAGMADALRLRREYAGQEVVFLYLAVNDTRDKWRQAVVQYATAEAGGLNYLVINSKDCKFLKEIQNRRIPHLLLYDRSGVLIDRDAPRPGDEKIRNELNRLLEQTIPTDSRDRQAR